MQKTERITVKLAEASTAQIREYATISMGLEIHGNAGKNAILAKMQEAGFDRDEIQVWPSHDQKAEKAKQSTAELAHEDETGRKFYRVLIAEQDKPGGAEPVAVSVNGKAMFIPRGEPVNVPAEYFEVLQNAVEFIYPEFDGSDLGGLKAPRKVQSYPFSVLGQV